MEIIVCVKHVPETAEAEIAIDSSGKGIKTEDLVFDINEWDDYAVEEAVLIKEKLGGRVTIVTVGSEDADKTLRKCLAKGADRAIRLTDKAFDGSDAYATAKILYGVIKDLPFDLILTGTQAGDDGYAQVGVILAGFLGIPHATMVKKIELMEGFTRVNRELEGGLEQVMEVGTPALLAVQTGINEPRYVSIMGIRKARQKELKVLGLNDLGLKEEEVGESGSWITVEEMFIPPVEKEAEILVGGLDAISSKIVETLRARGLI
ncbi:MAG: electron transfer flavoprotein subunit beta/FixA family protein [Candidatus Bathyarchaeota archaeon]|nr:MAG: electron transfer flavoprotein subunit beta/FixA family protein [Candidatus Bathyarchaeota archaeon]